MGNNNKEKESYEAAIGVIKEIVALCGTKAIEDAALELSNEDYDKYRLHHEELINIIVDIVKLQERQFDFPKLQSDLQSDLQADIQDKEFWEEIEESVKQRTRSFMKVIPYRKLEEEKRVELIDKGFDIVYKQRENLQFLIQEIDDEALAKALFEIFLGSEYIIANRYTSKRQFKDIIINNICLQDGDMEYIWGKYMENIAIVEKIATVRGNTRIENNISYLTRRINDLENLLQLVLNGGE